MKLVELLDGHLWFLKWLNDCNLCIKLSSLPYLVTKVFINLFHLMEHGDGSCIIDGEITIFIDCDAYYVIGGEVWVENNHQ